MIRNFVFILCVLLVLSTKSGAQTYAYNQGFFNGDVVTTCGGTFYDDDTTGAYSPNLNYSVTFCSGSPGKVIQVRFTKLSIAPGDSLIVYDGNSLNAPGLDTFTGLNSNAEYVTPSLFNASGCLTFKFTSTNAGEKEGWTAKIECIFPCIQRILGIPASSPLPDVSGYTNICFGDTVGLKVAASYPDNNTYYRQSDSTSYFHWYFGDGTDTSGRNLTKIKHNYKGYGGYYAKVTIRDSNGCPATVPIHIPVRTGMRPIFNIAAPPAICLRDTFSLTPTSITGGQGSVDMQMGSFINLPVSGDSVFLPDEPPKCFTSTLQIDQFAPGQRLTNISDLKGIYMNLEHSYHGDITISITAPNGVKVMLKSTTGGTADDGTFLGEPVDETLNSSTEDTSLVGIVGKGYQYIFNSNPQKGTMWDEASNYTYSFTDNAGRTVNNHYYLPAGSYTSEESLLNLLGTPLNGNWTLEICDKQAYDNGYLFNWKLEFDQGLFPNAETYTVPVISQVWLPSSGILSVNNTTATVAPAYVGNYQFTYRVKDTFGCKYDTVIKMSVNPLPNKPSLGPDPTICTGQTKTLTVANVQSGHSYNWSTGDTNVTSIDINVPGMYWVSSTSNKGCVNRDTVNVLPFNPFAVNAGNDTMFCKSKPHQLTAVASVSIDSWMWNTGDTTSAILLKGPGTYWVEGTNMRGCRVSDTVVVRNNPINDFSLPRDTVICANSAYWLNLYPPQNAKILWQDGSTRNSRLIDKTDTLRITANYAGCLSKSQMTIKTKPVPIVNIGADTTVCIGYDVVLTAGFPGAGYRWSNGSRAATIVAKTKGLYWVETDLNGCTYRDSLKLDQQKCDCDITMPNAFSPNGDGINDLYRPTVKCFPINYSLNIFNRYGQQVFYSKDYRTLWDGTKQGQQLPIGSYYYILSFFDNNIMKDKRVTGQITLLR